MQLEYDHYPAPPGVTAEPLILLHGLFGAAINWRYICQALQPGREIYALDLRNHGRSPHAASMTFPHMARDVFEFMAAKRLSSCDLLGHSLGGKVAMQAALERPEQFIRLIVADIAPKQYPPRHDDIFEAIDAVDRSTIGSRQQADELIKDILPDQATRLFLLTNLRRDDAGKFSWRINMDAIRKNYSIISGPPAVPGARYDKPALFIKGARSPYIKDEDRAEIQRLFPRAELRTIEQSGHWVHTEQPEEFLKIVREFLGK
ncbi:MAG TPA: alpha/beta fold hydrolase [Gammaproteobacteria bacterium]|nr:alpha/beta fold hydrolase [Gammaproteobacteria bacterium]